MFKIIRKLFSFNNKNGAFQVSSFSTKTSSKPKKLLKAFLYLEVGAFIGSYFLWRQMNHSQDFRYYLSKNFPSLLEGIFIAFLYL